MLAKLINISEAGSLAIHTMALLAGRPEKKYTTRKIAKIFNASENHLAKVMRQLVKNGFLLSVRGPNGGFKIKKPLKDILLLEILETIEGKLDSNTCLFKTQICNDDQCVMGKLSEGLNKKIIDYFTKTNLEMFYKNPVSFSEAEV